MATLSSNWTYTLTGSNPLTIDEASGLVFLSILCTVGKINVLGTKRVGTLNSTAITLGEGQGISFSSGDNSSLILDTIIIDPSGGGTALLTGR